jgi:hypothetical protein
MHSACLRQIAQVANVCEGIHVRNNDLQISHHTFGNTQLCSTRLRSSWLARSTGAITISRLLILQTEDAYHFRVLVRFMRQSIRRDSNSNDDRSIIFSNLVLKTTRWPTIRRQKYFYTHLAFLRSYFTPREAFGAKIMYAVHCKHRST